jgi:hypothetical protein
VLGQVLRRSWQAGAGPAAGRAGDRCRLLHRRGPRERQAARRPRLQRQARLSPVLATRADSGEALHVRLRKGRRTRRAARCASSTSSWRGSERPGRPGRSCCAPGVLGVGFSLDSGRIEDLADLACATKGVRCSPVAKLKVDGRPALTSQGRTKRE